MKIFLHLTKAAKCVSITKYMNYISFSLNVATYLRVAVFKGF